MKKSSFLSFFKNIFEIPWNWVIQVGLLYVLMYWLVPFESGGWIQYSLKHYPNFSIPSSMKAHFFQVFNSLLHLFQLKELIDSLRCLANHFIFLSNPKFAGVSLVNHIHSVTCLCIWYLIDDCSLHLTQDTLLTRPQSRDCQSTINLSHKEISFFAYFYRLNPLTSLLCVKNQLI